MAQAGPLSTLYLTYIDYLSPATSHIDVVQGNSITSFPEAYNAPNEVPIAVWGDVRTTGYSPGGVGGQYKLGGTPTGTSYVLPSPISNAFDSTSDGSHNYLVDYNSGVVYQTARDFTNPTALFGLGAGNGWFGITYDKANNSLWISSYTNPTVADYSLTGTLLSSFSTGHVENNALALDPADHTLWLVDDDQSGSNPLYGNLEQYSTAGVRLSFGPFIGTALGGEFNLAPATITAEPGTLILLGSGILGIAGVLRRKINL